MSRAVKLLESGSIQDIAKALAFGSASLTDDGLKSYLDQVSKDYENDLKYGRSGSLNKKRIEAAKLAMKLRKVK